MHWELTHKRERIILENGSRNATDSERAREIEREEDTMSKHS